ncbi:MAG: hypothetical protein HY367_00420 [Candidatus Aenigmarchaeota archaeon]|nr:hypothetical protein [Candidatus Aenigmarchaeota archaeon]
MRLFAGQLGNRLYQIGLSRKGQSNCRLYQIGLSRKGQVEPITLIIITGIVVALVGAAYAWGVPLIQKRTAVSDFSSAERFMVDLDQAITDVANRGGGERSVDIPKGFVTVDTALNAVLLEMSMEQPLLLDSTVPLRTTFLGDVGKFGEAEPRVIDVTVAREGTRYRMVLKAQYRELDTATTPLRGFKIMLNPLGRGVGTDRVVVSYGGNEAMPGAAANAGELILTRINVELQ